MMQAPGVKFTNFLGAKAEEIFAQIIFDAFVEKSVLQIWTKIWCSVQKH
jgi:hypothetical protein